MALADHLDPKDHGPAPEVRGDDRFVDDLDDRGTGRSNFVAFTLGGAVIAGGMLAFLYYDTNDLNRGDMLTTGTLGQLEMSSAPAGQAPRIAVQSQAVQGASQTPAR